ncbi:hypothetical protein J5N97_008073 [Dioscorea zingiberensis]|uniref:NPH3 domain-containing protein n=1 Tax=Dioscorea zingiberensis TaxID=325984 RepID=A0A9D5HWI1_9LILI|nr:hypothetical protein J5N97_008073 [Dioscorea zingiberensis]
MSFAGEEWGPRGRRRFHLKEFDSHQLVSDMTNNEEAYAKMKYMKIGTKPDVFYTEEATRSVLSDVPTDLIIIVNNTKYLLHKFPLLLKCGLLQRLSSDTDEGGTPTPVTLHDFPGNEEAFELCAKFCYGITINLSAHNFLAAITAARFLRMTESVAKGNLVMKLESFFEACILNGWKDSIVILQSAGRLPAWSENPRIVRPCVDAVVEKILTHPSKVEWSFTYTRPGYNQKQHRSVPKDWWTEDVSELDLDLFRSVISAVRSSKKLSPQLIGEALHVYACKHLPDTSLHFAAAESSSPTEETLTKHRKVLESIVSMIPGEHGSVSGRFLLKLLKVANQVGASPSTKAELVRRSGRQLDEATPEDLVFPSPTNPISFDIGIVEAILENFLAQQRRPLGHEERERMAGAMARVAKVFDSYMQAIAHDPRLSVSKLIELAESLPEIARQEHDELYHAIDTYLKEHPELSKAERKKLCKLIDCRKLSPNACSHAIGNDRLPLRTIVQLLFVEQERARRASSSRGTPLPRPSVDISNARAESLIDTGKAESREAMRMERSRSVSELKAVKKEREAEKAAGSRSKSKAK